MFTTGSEKNKAIKREKKRQRERGRGREIKESPPIVSIKIRALYTAFIPGDRESTM